MLILNIMTDIMGHADTQTDRQPDRHDKVGARNAVGARSATNLTNTSIVDSPLAPFADTYA